MNFIITLECNKGCPYCFAHENRVTDPTRLMTVGQYKKLLAKLDPNQPVKLLGGEPTMHPNFKEFVDIAIEQNRQVVIISNFLFNDDILDFIKSRINKANLGFLVNSTNLDIQDRMARFSKNYNEIFKEAYKYSKEESISCGITFENSDISYYLNYLNFLKTNLCKIERLRMSLNFPGDKDNKNKFFFLNNKEYGKLFIAMTQACLTNCIMPSIDCIIFPCMFSNREEIKYIHKFSDIFNTRCNQLGAPADIFPDETISYCYPLRNAIKVDSNDHTVLDSADRELSLKYEIAKSNVIPPEPCQTCEFIKKGSCEGPCLGFFDL